MDLLRRGAARACTRGRGKGVEPPPKIKKQPEEEQGQKPAEEQKKDEEGGKKVNPPNPPRYAEYPGAPERLMHAVDGDE